MSDRSSEIGHMMTWPWLKTISVTCTSRRFWVKYFDDNAFKFKYCLCPYILLSFLSALDVALRSGVFRYFAGSAPNKRIGTVRRLTIVFRHGFFQDILAPACHPLVRSLFSSRWKPAPRSVSLIAVLFSSPWFQIVQHQDGPRHQQFATGKNFVNTSRIFLLLAALW